MKPSRPAATLSLEESAGAWPVVVVGAGVAGAAAAREWARMGVRTLLVDRGAFPRGKVCGGCLNGSAVASLAAMGLGKLPEEAGGRPLRSVALYHRGRRATLPTPAGWAVSREAFDAALVSAAIQSGAAFLPGASARIVSLGGDGTPAELLLSGDEGKARLTAEAVVCADGLSGQSLRGLSPFSVEIHPQARIGAGAVFASVAGESPLPPGVIQMACGRNGYVGLVAVEGDRIDVAAAFDPDFLRAAASPADAARKILDEAGLAPPAGLAGADWSGTAPLTRTRRPFAAGRVFLVGDSAGYVEPFTGEGMAWALEGARRLVGRLGRLKSFLNRGEKPPPEPDWAAAAADWDRAWSGALRTRRRTCRLVTAALRSSWVWGGAFALLRQAPWLAAPVVGWLNAPPRLPDSEALQSL